MFEWIDHADQLNSLRKEHKEFFVLAFLGEFSEAARRARRELETFAAEYEEVPVLAVDVATVKDIHPDYCVERVPTVLAVEHGEVKKTVEGVQSARFYGLHFAGATPSRATSSEGGRLEPGDRGGDDFIGVEFGNAGRKRGDMKVSVGGGPRCLRYYRCRKAGSSVPMVWQAPCLPSFARVLVESTAESPQHPVLVWRDDLIQNVAQMDAWGNTIQFSPGESMYRRA
jgi:hypothetical protein